MNQTLKLHCAIMQIQRNHQQGIDIILVLYFFFFFSYFGVWHCLFEAFLDLCKVRVLLSLFCFFQVLFKFWNCLVLVCFNVDTVIFLHIWVLTHLGFWHFFGFWHPKVFLYFTFFCTFWFHNSHKDVSHRHISHCIQSALQWSDAM